MHSKLTSLFFLSLLAASSFAIYSGPNGVSPARHVNRHHHHQRAAARQSATGSQDFTKRASSGSTKKQKRCAAKATGGNIANAVTDNAAPGVAGAADPVTSVVPTTTTSHKHATTTTTTHKPKATPHQAAPAPGADAAPADAGSGSGADSGPFDQSVIHSGGDATYYGIGLGACGWTNTEPDLIVAIAHELFDSYATTDAEKNNPNLNPVCGQFIEASLPGLGSVRVKVVDRCGGCDNEWSLDFSEAAFNQLTNNGMAVGRFHDLSWHYTN